MYNTIIKERARLPPWFLNELKKGGQLMVATFEVPKSSNLTFPNTTNI